MSTTYFELGSVNNETEPTGLIRQSYPTKTVSSLVKEYGKLRDETSVLDADVTNNHREIQKINLENYARELLREDVKSLLKQITDLGMGWSDIARIVGVSVQAVRKWRNNEPITPQNRFKIARLLAFLKLMESIPVYDPVSWLEATVKEGYLIRHIDFYEKGRPDLLLELANLRTDGETALTELDPDWRDNFIAKHEVFESGDGNLSIRRK